MRQRIARHEDRLAPQKANSPGGASRSPVPDLGAFFSTAQVSYGNRAVSRLLRASLTRTCSCGKATGSAEQCEECRAKSLDPGHANASGESRATITIESDQDSETAVGARDRSISVEGGSKLTRTADGESSCSVTGKFTDIPSGTVNSTLSGTELGARFNMKGTFSPSIPCNCSCGEYRQYVRGTFERNGATVTHALCGTNLDPTKFQEDCGIFGGTSYRYGYRSQSFATSKFTNPDQATGCDFEGRDFPRLGGSSGDKLEVNLDFQGRLIDTCHGNAVIASSDWSVVGTATVP